MFFANIIQSNRWTCTLRHSKYIRERSLEQLSLCLFLFFFLSVSGTRTTSTTYIISGLLLLILWYFRRIRMQDDDGNYKTIISNFHCLNIVLLNVAHSIQLYARIIHHIHYIIGNFESYSEKFLPARVKWYQTPENYKWLLLHARHSSSFHFTCSLVVASIFLHQKL